MSKARARERKKKRLALAQATGITPAAPVAAEPKYNTGKFDAQIKKDNKGGKASGGKSTPNLAASSRGAARSS